MLRGVYSTSIFGEHGTAMEHIERTITIEDLVDAVPESVRYLIDRGLPCIVCGQPAWGTLEEMVKDKGRTDAELETIVSDINALIATRRSG
jgi:methionine synthase II (cobalamin-independent)